MQVDAPRIFTVSCLCALLAASGCHKGEEAETEAVVAVKVVKVERKDVVDSVTAVGTVNAVAVTTLSPKVSAPIVEMGILKNHFVVAGEEIARLESRDLAAAAREADDAVREAEATLRQTAAGTNPESTAQKQKALSEAEATVRNAEALVRRRETLFAKGGIPKKELEDAQLQLAVARGELDLARRELQLATATLNPTSARIAETRLQQARDRAANAHAQLDYAVIRSPISGVITDQFHQRGDFVAAGDKLVTVADVRQIVVKAQFPDSIVADVHNGANVQLAPSTGEEAPMFGTVTLVSRAADPASRTVEVWVSAVNEDNRLRPGEFTKVTIVTEEATDAITVPPAAVTLDEPDGDKGKVMVVDETSVAHEVEVTVGVKGEDAWEITEGLGGDETVIVEGNYALPDGTKVRTVEAAAEEEEKGEEKDAGEKPADKKEEP
jgi:multidrug efflux pump subunit AcrA (membrane-fusion protein)